MFTSELITAQHLARTAIIYIRQSTPHQVLSNQESLHLQYALQQRALDLGWTPSSIQIIDLDLGVSAVAAHHREGFKELAAKVTLGQVGIILSLEVQRLSRNCSDWYPLLDVCGYKGTLIADRDGIYDPASPNGRLLLGLKGALSEMEMHTMRSRLTAGLLNKARRGELALSLPLGLIRDEHGRVQKTPDLEVQRRIELVFSCFLELRSACRVLRFFNEHELSLPGRDPFGDIIWKKPTTSAIISLLKNPAYAGASVYGRSRCARKTTAQLSYSITRLPIEEWKFVVKDKYPPYIGWETFEKIRVMLKDNYAEYDRNKTRGVPRPGKALLHGLLYCGECGHKLTVQYKHGPEYLCTFLRQKYRAPVCQRISSDEVDRRVVNAFFEALSPIELDLYARAMETQKQRDEQVARARHQQLERLRYEAALAQRHLLRTDPDNRLVAAELETRWEAALRELKQAEESLAQEEPPTAVPFARVPAGKQRDDL